MNDSELSKVNHEKDLGIAISNDLKSDKHFSDIVKKKGNFWVKFETKSYHYTI